MRLNINLASQPYEVAQAYRRRMTRIIAALGLIAALLVGYIVYQRRHSRGINQQLAATQQQIRSLEAEEAQARAILNKPANRVIADQSDFLNQIFARKSLSWTRICTEMEKIVPAGLHVVSMKPELSKTNDLVLHVIVATDSRDRAVEMVRHMETSSHLRQAQIVAESVTTNSSDQAAGGGNIQFDIAAVYVPGGAESDDTTAAPDEAGAKTTTSQPPAAVVNKSANPTAANAANASTSHAPSGPGNLNSAQNRPVPPGSSGAH
jgi:type IV pilus assembly protein PilN